MELSSIVKKIVETGKVDIGTKRTVGNIVNGKAKAVVISSNCPKKTRQDITYYAKLSNTPLVVFEGTSLQLGELCGKPFVVSGLSVLEAGGVSLNELIGKQGDK